MKMVKDKKILVGADFAGFPLKEAVCEHLREKGWEITDVGVKVDSDPDDTTPRVGEGDDFCLVTDAFLDAYSDTHDKCHNRDKSLYPATPEA